jgi:hypothetical protein
MTSAATALLDLLERDVKKRSICASQNLASMELVLIDFIDMNACAIQDGLVLLAM